MKVLFSGIQPTGTLHIGNYFGAIKNWVKIQYDYKTYISVVDYHAITIEYDPGKMPEKVMDLTINLFACGIDLEKTILFIQSEVTGHADLTWIFNSVTPMGELERMTQFKDKAKQHKKNVNVGLFDYPVLQAADILLYKGEVVPVGEDQVQHIEFTREVARYFNKRYGKTFPECEALLTKSPRIMGLDGENKMSKSMNNFIGILETENQIWDKVSVAKTDPARIKKTDPGNPFICNIYYYHKLVTNEEAREEVAEGCRTAGIGCLDCKKIFVTNLMRILNPIRERYENLKKNTHSIREILNNNADKCRHIAKQTLLETKERLGLNPVWKL
ncbi:MAG: tryptophan--tRNA ligase [Spirochaetales bacterium]|nr:tryptophan--tRNA ligase [Spirochaetales bacterium]